MAKSLPFFQWLPKTVERGVIFVIIGVLSFGVWLGWVLKPGAVVPVDIATPIATAPVGITAPPTKTSQDYWLSFAGLVRTTEHSQTAQAAMVTLLNQWSRLGLPNTEMKVSGPRTMQMDSFPFELSLLERLDYPTVIKWQAGEHAPLTSAVLFGLNADTATILDPLHGVVNVKRKRLSERVAGEAKIFWQPLSGVYHPFQEEDTTNSLEILQQHLVQSGFGNTNDNVSLEQRVEAGVSALQQFYGLEPTGIFTKEVHLVLVKEMYGQQVPSLMLPPALPVTK